IKLFYDSALTNGVSSPGLKGNFSTVEALSRLLAGSGLTFRQTGANAYTLERVPLAAEGAVQLGPVRVEGASGTGGYGAASSRDVGATEGTGSYTTQAVTLGKTPASIRETPQSISVVTRQRIEDQNFTDVGDALRFTTGLTTQSVGGVYTEHTALARGANADYQIDGMNQNVDSRAAQFDLAIYDRVEVLRGPAGLFRGAGSAGATINLVRKRALSDFQVSGTAGAGSWGGYRFEGDITGALTASGDVRARLIGVTEDKGSHLDGVDNKKHLVHGLVEFDVASDTTFSAGGTYQDASMDYFYGLPAYLTGELVDVPRSQSYVAPWADGSLENFDVFGELEHRLPNGGTIKATVRHSESDRSSQTLFSGGGLNPAGMQSLSSNWESIENNNTAADIFVDMPFSAFGGNNNFLIGADFQDYSQSTLRKAFNFPQVDFFDFDPTDIPQPDFESLPLVAHSLSKVRSYGIYSQLRLKPLQPLTLIGGARLSWRETTSDNYLNNTQTAGPDVSAKFSPYAGATLDVLANWSVYGSYAEVFQPQSGTTFAGDLLEPITGGQYELGIKGELMDQRVNVSAALYRTVRSNEALSDPVNPGFSIAGGKRRAQGLEAEVSGEIAEGLNLTVGYAYNETKVLIAAQSQIGQVYAPTTPKHNFTLWANYRFLEASALSGLEAGAGLRANSEFYSQVGTVRFVADGYTV
ncbi:MAG: TonB-dependent siderophore receptor, partial [Oxalobacteraceae bacterium]